MVGVSGFPKGSRRSARFGSGRGADIQRGCGYFGPWRRAALHVALRQERNGRPTGFTQVGPQSVMPEDSVIPYGEPVRLVCLSVHHEDIRVFVTHDLKAHAPLPRQHRSSHRKRRRRSLIIP
jgi:hypothetical protein